ncbi:protein kinase [Streptomyces lateritius]|uniref:non-specific serine/threonine protein kinase n=1 Tax=Streptomyces lateritius TaxID=67313 RepID=A0ABW6YAJ7_9ACTN
MPGEVEDSSNLKGSGAKPLESGDPRRIGAFRLLGVLGSGGMGRVYLGAVPGKFAAVKRVLPILAEDADFLRHFGHELDNLARLPGGASARLLASDRTAKPPWFATEYIPGITLNEAMRLNGGPLSGAALWRLLRGAASGLRAVHTADMVHRDLKPSNVMLTRGGLSLIDFGVARAADQSRLTRTGMVIGTPAYMAPEQAVADPRLTGAADVFALGSLVLYAANGRPPFGDGSGPDLLYRVVHGEPEFGKLAETEPELAALVRSCLAKDPASRPTAADLVGLTDEHVPEDALWPEAVAERITERASFAAEAPTAGQLAALGETERAAEQREDVVTTPLTPQRQRPKKPATPPPDPAVATGAATSDKRPERRNRFLVLAVPVVVATGTTLTVALGPYVIGPRGDGPGTSAAPPSTSSSAPAPADRTPPPGGPSSRPPGSPSTPGSVPPPGGTAAGGGGGAGGGTAAGGGGGATAGGGGSPVPGGSGSSDSSGSPASSGGSSGSGGSGGGSGSPGGSGGGSGGSTTRPAPPPPPPPSSGGGGSAPSGTYSLENASNGQCLAEQDAGFAIIASTAECGSPSSNGGTMSYAWTYSPGANGTFRLVNRKTGRCLQPSGNSSMTVTACNGSSLQSWKIGTSTSSGRTIKNMNNGGCMVTGPFVMTYTCDPGNRSHLWRNISPV